MPSLRQQRGRHRDDLGSQHDDFHAGVLQAGNPPAVAPVAPDRFITVAVHQHAVVGHHPVKIEDEQADRPVLAARVAPGPPHGQEVFEERHIRGSSSTCNESSGSMR